MVDNLHTASTGERGPAEHRTRTQILEAADAHFRHHGYRKTTVADLAKEIGVSPAYIYKFFSSKQAIGEAVCGRTLERILEQVRAVAEGSHSATERLRRVYRVLVIQGLALYFNERRLHDIVSSAIEENWSPIARYRQELTNVMRRLISEGRESGEFERKTPLDDASTAVVCTLVAFAHPILLEQTEPDELRNNAEHVASLVLRSLAP